VRCVSSLGRRARAPLFDNRRLMMRVRRRSPECSDRRWL